MQRRLRASFGEVDGYLQALDSTFLCEQEWLQRRAASRARDRRKVADVASVAPAPCRSGVSSAPKASPRNGKPSADARLQLDNG